MVHLNERGQKVELMDVPVGTVLHIKTGNSNWYLCRVEGSALDTYGYNVKGVMIVTDSEAWGRITHSPHETSVSSEIKVGDVFGIATGARRSNTGDVRSITYES